MKRAFTFVEVLIVVAVILILVALTARSFSKLRDNQTLNSTLEQTSAIIDEARFKTVGSKNDLQYGVHFETNRVVLFEGDVFTEPTSSNKEFTISDLVEISSISLNGSGSDLIFKRLTGETDQYGTITIRLKNNTSNTKDIIIENSGAINVQI